MRQEALGVNLRKALREVKDFESEGDYKVEARLAVKQFLESKMNTWIDRELEAIRSREGGGEDRRNGHYERHLLTEMGDVVLAVPRTRKMSAAGLLEQFGRRPRSVDRMILECFVLGLSTRKVGQALLPVLGEKVSAQTVSQVARELDGLVAAYHNRRLKDGYRALIFDGVVLKRKTGVGSKKRTVLVALGIRPDGKKEVIDFGLAGSESEAEWTAFLNHLYRRGLEGDGTEIIVVDGGKGMRAGLRQVYPYIPVQRCWAHKTRNVLDKVKKADQPSVKVDLQHISHAPRRTQARKALRHFKQSWEARYPKAVACLLEDEEELLEFLRLPPQWHVAVRTTNAIERRFVEVRRRTRPMGVFSDRTSMERILYAVFNYENTKQGVNPILLLTHNN